MLRQLVNVKNVGADLTAPGQRQELVRQTRHILRGLLHDIQILDHGLVGRHFPADKLGISEQRSQEIVEIVRDLSRQRPGHFQTLRAGQPGLHGTGRIVGGPAGQSVMQYQTDGPHPWLLLRDGLNRHLEGDRCAAFPVAQGIEYQGMSQRRYLDDHVENGLIQVADDVDHVEHEQRVFFVFQQVDRGVVDIENVTDLIDHHDGLGAASFRRPPPGGDRHNLFTEDSGAALEQIDANSIAHYGAFTCWDQWPPD